MSDWHINMTCGGDRVAIRKASKFTTEEQSEEAWWYHQSFLKDIADTPSIHDEIIIKKENKDEH